MMETITIDRLSENAKRVATDAIQRFGEAASAGDGFRQGDVLVCKLDSVPMGLKKLPVELQVAPGNTQGSRHAWQSPNGLSMYRHKDSDEYTGPIYKLEETNVLTHPEHGHVEVSPGVYGVSYQRTVDSEQRIWRVQD